MLSKRNIAKKQQLNKILERKELLKNKQRIRQLIKKQNKDISDEERAFLQEHSWLHGNIIKSVQTHSSQVEKLKEFTESPDVTATKIQHLASLFRAYEGRVLVYTGAGMSTAASIPDYRGPQGKYTLAGKGTVSGSASSSRFSLPEASTAQPTLAHMGLAALVREGFIRHVVSQNVDGLHLRSGLPREKLSEIHGNIFSEICVTCGKEVLRNFDVTEKTGRHRHVTGRFCSNCGHLVSSEKESSTKLSKSDVNTSHHGQLNDTIVHFGEHSRDIGEPCVYRWRVIEHLMKGRESTSTVDLNGNADSDDDEDDWVDPVFLILCLGSSLRVLRHYGVLWPHVLKSKKKNKCPLSISSPVSPPLASQLAIVNLQWTPLDKHASLRLHADCQLVVQGLVHHLLNSSETKTPMKYCPEDDPLQSLYVPLKSNEEITKIRPYLTFT